MVSGCRCCADLQTHLEKSVLLQLPSTYQSVFRQSSEKETDMVPRPQLDTFVVCKTKYYLGHIQLEDSGDGESDSRQLIYAYLFTLIETVVSCSAYRFQFPL
ncbi:unnamed protein product [Malus baccata var. baccata]